MNDELLELLQAQDQHAVIRWTMHKRFTYVAVKVGAQWYTTATDLNNQVGQIVSTPELVNLLVSALTPFEVATQWKEVL